MAAEPANYRFVMQFVPVGIGSRRIRDELAKLYDEVTKTLC
jgi:hypothetical protein